MKALTSVQRRALTPAMRLALEPEVVHGKDLEAITEAARLRDHQRLQERGAILDQLPLEIRIRNARTVARSHHVDFAREERLLRYMLAHNGEGRAVRRITLLEAQLGQRA